MAQQCQLLELPAELRNHIYRYALVDVEAIDVTSREQPNEPALLATCKEIRSEASWIYYRENIFRSAIRPKNWYSWLVSLGRDRCQLLTRLEIQWSIEGPSVEDVKRCFQQPRETCWYIQKFLEATVNKEEFICGLIVQVCTYHVLFTAVGISHNIVDIVTPEPLKNFDDAQAKVAKILWEVIRRKGA